MEDKRSKDARSSALTGFLIALLLCRSLSGST
jgi:hypothetical protein